MTGHEYYDGQYTVTLGEDLEHGSYVELHNIGVSTEQTEICWTNKLTGAGAGDTIFGYVYNPYDVPAGVYLRATDQTERTTYSPNVKHFTVPAKSWYRYDTTYENVVANLSILEAIEAAYAQHYVVAASAGYRSTINNYSCIQTKVQDPEYGPIVSFGSFNKDGTGTNVYMTVEDDAAVANAFAPCNAGIVYIYVPAGAETQFRLFRKDWNLHREITLTAGQWNRVEFDIDFVVNESIAGFMIQFVNPVDGLKLSGIYGVK